MERFFEDKSKLTEKDHQSADEFRTLVCKRMKCKSEEISCPYSSDDAPCVARDGRLALGESLGGKPLCIGCDRSLLWLLKKERSKYL